MGMLESLKEKIEKVTRWKRPSRDYLRHAVKARKPNAFRFKGDGVVPNNPKLPFILYRGPVTLTDDFDPAAVFEELFGRNGWRDSWHNGIFTHTITREPTKCSVLRAVMPGFVSAVNAEKSFASRPAMLWSCPAGTGHQRLAASKDFALGRRLSALRQLRRMPSLRRGA